MIPVKFIPTVFHVGTLNPDHVGQHGARGGNSHEGHHLSVSLHPDAWRVIARLGDHPTHTLTRPDGAFLDAHAAQRNPALMQGVHAWGAREGLTRPGERWAAWHTDDDGDPRFSLHATAADAALEAWEAAAQALEDDSDLQLEFDSRMADVTRDTPAGTIETIAALIAPRRFVTRKTVTLPTPLLETRTGLRRPDDATDALLIAWAHAQTFGEQPLDGVWWDEHLDPAAYSAPRGLIFRDRLGDWRAAP